MKVVFSPLARRHLKDLRRYIAERSSTRVANTYVERIVRYCGEFDTFPHRGHARDDLAAGLRTVGFGGRVTIAFFVTSQAVDIAGIYYGGRRFEANFDEGPSQT